MSRRHTSRSLQTLAGAVELMLSSWREMVVVQASACRLPAFIEHCVSGERGEAGLAWLADDGAAMGQDGRDGQRVVAGVKDDRMGWLVGLSHQMAGR